MFAICPGPCVMVMSAPLCAITRMLLVVVMLTIMMAAFMSFSRLAEHGAGGESQG